MSNPNIPDDQGNKTSDTYQHDFDPATDSVSTELLRAITVVENTDPTELAVLAEVIDPEAMDTLFQSFADDRPRNADVHVKFKCE